MKKYMKIVLILFATLLLIQLLRLWSLKRQVGQYKTYWQNLAAKDAPADSIWYVALGDSAGQGIGASKPQNGYIGRVSEEIAKRVGKPVHTINLSVSGAKIADIVSDQIPTLSKLKLPEGSMVTVEVGANDMQNFEPARFEAEFAQMLSQLPAGAYVSDVPYFGKGLFRAREASVAQANTIVHRLLGKYKVKPVYLHESTEKHSSWLNNAADMFHPNDRGYHWWFEAFIKEIE